MKRVLVVGPVPPPEGGVASVLLDIVHSDLADSYQFDLFPRQPSLPEELKTSLGRNIYRFKRFAHFLGKLLRNHYYLVHIHSPDSAFRGTVIFSALAKLAGTPVLLHQHGTDWESFYPEASAFRKFYTRAGLRMPTRVLVLYELWKREIEKIVPNSHVQVLRNLAHDIPPSSEADVKAIKRQWEIADDDFLVVTVGSVGWRKGSYDIVRSAPRIAEQDPKIKLVLVGYEEKAGEFEETERLRHELGVEDTVILTGEAPRSAVPHFLAAADAFLLPSYSEGMPISIIEAMRSGLAIVSTPIAGIPEMITNEESGLLIPVGAPDDIASAVIRLKNDEGLRRKLGENARKAFEERFEFSRGIAEVRRIYTSLLDSR